jgi:nucleoside-diphosphate-sugar epimerase
MKYFVTGGTGFIGRRLVAQLLAAGHQVNILARKPSLPASTGQPGTCFFQGDITVKESMRAAMIGVDGVFHLAAWYKIGAHNKAEAERINVEGTRNVLELMRELRVPKGVYTSTIAVFSDTRGFVPDEQYRYRGRWLSEYERTKAAAHYDVAAPLIEAGLPLVIVQPSVVYGAGDPSAIGDMFRQYLLRKLPMVPEKTAYSWAYVDDVARGHVLAMENGRPTESYIIAGPVHTVADALQVAQRITGISTPRLHAPPLALKALSAAARVFETVLPLPERYASETLRLAAGRTYLGSAAKAEEELGFSARPLDAGLRETLPEEMKRLGIPLSATQRPDATES